MGMYYALEITDVLSDYLTGRGRGGGEERGRPEINWERQVERLTEQKNLTPDEAGNWKTWRKATEK